MYRPLPRPPAPEPDQPRAHYAARLFAWFLTDDANTATPTDLELELAAYGARLATDVRGALPAYYDAVAAAERIVCAAVRRRAAIAQASDPEPCPATADRPTIGPMAPVPTHPTPPAPPTPERLPMMPAPARPGDTIRF